MIEKFANSEYFMKVLPLEQINNLASYFIMLPSEVAMKLWSVLGPGPEENLYNFHQSKIDGRQVVQEALIEMHQVPSEE